MKLGRLSYMDKTKQDFIAARKARGMSQREWSNLLGVSYSSVTKWESEKSPAVPPRYIMRQIRELEPGKLKLKLDDATQAKLDKKLAENGKTLDQFIADLLKAVLVIAALYCLAS